MLLYGRVGREFGRTPLNLAVEYGFISQAYYDGLRHDERIMIDHHVLNELIRADNKAQKDALKKDRDKPDLDSHRGMHGRLSVEELAERQAAKSA
jgi:hypothetical protein